VVLVVDEPGGTGPMDAARSAADCPRYRVPNPTRWSSWSTKT
jgi:hypothetical protein